MRLFLGILAIFIFSQFIFFSVSAADCIKNSAGDIVYDGSGKSLATEVCCQSYAQYNQALCASKVSGGTTVKLPNPIQADSIPELIGQVINVALGVVGSLALIMFIYGGFTWMLAAGNEKAVEKGKNVLIWATIGLVVIFASYSLVNFIINQGIRGV